jgi:hypothetical protein
VRFDGETEVGAMIQQEFDKFHASSLRVFKHNGAGKDPIEFQD